MVILIFISIVSEARSVNYNCQHLSFLMAKIASPTDSVKLMAPRWVEHIWSTSSSFLPLAGCRLWLCISLYSNFHIFFPHYFALDLNVTLRWKKKWVKIKYLFLSVDKLLFIFIQTEWNCFHVDVRIDLK